MTTLRTVAASVTRRLARLRPEVRAAEEALAAGDADRALALTDSDIRSRPDDRALLAVRRRAFAARGDQTGVAATLAALRRTRGGDGVADTERRLHGDLAETDPRWRPRVRGPRRAIEPRSDRVVLHLLKESLPQRQTGFTMRSHANLVAQRAAGWDPVVVTALWASHAPLGGVGRELGGGRWDPPSPARSRLGLPGRRSGRHVSRGLRLARRGRGAGRAPGDHPRVVRRAGVRVRARGSRARERTWTGRSCTRCARSSTARRQAPIERRPTRPRHVSATGDGTRPRCARCWRPTLS